MSIDPGLLTDSTGEGMSGAEDVSLLTQQKLKNTVYNGSKKCKGCDADLDPYRALSHSHCAPCKNKKDSLHLKNRMAP